MGLHWQVRKDPRPRLPQPAVRMAIEDDRQNSNMANPMKQCVIWVQRRTYSPAGRCEKKQSIREIDMNGKKVQACSGHRQMIRDGKKLELAVVVIR